ncbi:MAG: hypothetical protein DRP42_00705 [Tenericutes bacterium]|nr:MAG: hypothetical protein DRP42_00705 [Mycoplasmatota bacterium]
MSEQFDYLLKEASQTSAVSADRLMLMAKTASGRFLRENVPLNDTIQKFAEDNDLNGHQVERVCEMANITTHQSMWPSAPEKEKIAFPLASPKVIILSGGSGASSSGGCCHSPASAGADYMGPPSMPAPGPSMAEMFGEDPSAGHSGMRGPGPAKKIIIIMQRKEAQAKRIRDELLVEGMKYESEKKAAYNAVKQEVLGGTSLAVIQDAANAAGFGKLAAEILPEFQKALVAETYGPIKTALEKVAIAPAPEELISKNLGNTTIVNGAHPILISLDVLHRKDDRIKVLSTGLTNVNDELKVYGQKIREL